ncbi:NACHT domain-containing protein [Streptomyces uncialis]|uniref:NACHT domain-containing protein n=1 Tax=Streptomyces uncialis TaxID=1048205 RepID=UPI00380BFEA1
MDPSVLGVRLASSAITPLIRQLFVREGPGAGLVDRPVRLSSYFSLRGERRTLAPTQVRGLALRLIRDAVASPGERPFPADEENAVADALTRTLCALGDLDMDDVQAVRLGHRELARTLYTRAAADGPAPDHELSADASVFLTSAVEWASLHILQFFTQRSTFVARTLVDQSRAQTEMIAKLDELITRAPRPDARRASFERRYRAQLAAKHGKLTIYGIDLTSTPGVWPLDVAYLSLMSTEETDEYGAHGVEPGTGAPGAAHSPGRFTPAHTTTHLADQILATHPRVLLRGVAGSGKTTLVQWLAVSATRAAPDGPLGHLHGLMPFVLPLRTLTRHGERLPGPERFLEAAGSPLAGAQPDGWADHVLIAGRGLILVDGIDEVPAPERARARTWLADLIAAYPGNRWLVTSRPSAVRERWLADDGFAELTLSPMSTTDVAAFIHRWHSAARSGAAEPHLALLDGYERQLLTAVRTKPDLGRLATNPLMCGLICALHRDRHGYLPHGRRELYEAALAMLLSRRDRERDVLGDTGAELRQEPQTQLLQRLAYWLIRNGRTEMDRDRAEAVIGEALPAMPEAAAIGDAGTVFAHLLLRSGLLLEPSPGAVTFVHRTFQDYLGARAAVEAWDIGLLTGHAADDQWEDVIRMAIAHARPRERAELLDGMLSAGDALPEGRERNRVHLMAGACLEQATELDPAVRARVAERVNALIPPPNPEAARELATVGPLVLDLLPGPGEYGEHESRMAVITATRVQSDAAIPFLTRYAGTPYLSVRSQLVWSWFRFDTARYAEEVIAELDPEGLYFVVQNETELRVLGELGGRPLVQLWGDIEPSVIAEYVSRYRPTTLVFDVPRDVRVPPWKLLRSLDKLESLILTFVDPDMPADDWRELGKIPRLTELGVDVRQLLTMADTLTLPELTDLELFVTQPTEPIDVSAFPDRFPRLSLLTIHPTGPADVPLLGLDRLPESLAVIQEYRS